MFSLASLKLSSKKVLVSCRKTWQRVFRRKHATAAVEVPEDLALTTAPADSNCIVTDAVIHAVIPEPQMDNSEKVLKESDSSQTTQNLSLKPIDMPLIESQDPEVLERVEAFRKRVMASHVNHIPREVPSVLKNRDSGVSVSDIPIAPMKLLAWEWNENVGCFLPVFESRTA